MREFVATVLVFLFGIFTATMLVGCSAISVHKPCCASEIPSFPKTWFRANHAETLTNFGAIPVLHFPPNVPGDAAFQGTVFVLHELPGMTPECLRLATNLAASGFEVYLPELKGKPNNSRFLWFTICESINNTRWRLFSKAKTPGVIGDLRQLLRQWSSANSNQPVGIIGMCSTGALPLALLSETNVAGVVLSQPALPLVSVTYSRRAALNLSPEDLRIAKDRVHDAVMPIMGLRFQDDTICPADRFVTLRFAFGTNFIDRTIGHQGCENQIRANAHSVLCEDFNPATNSPTVERLDEVKGYFKLRLARQYGIGTAMTGN